jgi:hypothetical protein
MEMPTVATSTMALHLIVDDEESALGQRGSRFFARMLAYYTVVILLSTLLTVAPINYSSAGQQATPSAQQTLEKSYCSDVQTSEDCADGRADPICADTDGCMPCAVDSSMTCLRYEDAGKFCDDWRDGAGGYGGGYGELDHAIVHMDLVYMPLIGLLSIAISALGVCGSFRRSRVLFALHAVLLPALALTSIICTLVGVLMGNAEGSDCEDRPPSDIRENICARVAPYYGSAILFLLLALAHGYAVQQHYEAGTYSKGISALVNLIRATSPDRDGQLEMASLDGSMPPTLAEAHEEIRRLRSQVLSH